MYNKLFGKILDSSIWLEATPTRIVWITLLAAMDEDGFAHFSAIENLAARARVTVEEAREAVECFLAPDPNSGNPANDGRRIDRVPGGFMVLNAAEHRKTITRVIQREETRIRVAKHRAKKAILDDVTKSVTPLLQNDTRPPYTEAYTDTDTKAEAITTLASSDKISLSAEGNWIGIPKAFLKKWHEAYPAINIEIELAKAAGWIMANPKNKKSNYARFLTNWLSRSQDRAPARGPGSAKPSRLDRMATAMQKHDEKQNG